MSAVAARVASCLGSGYRPPMCYEWVTTFLTLPPVECIQGAGLIAVHRPLDEFMYPRFRVRGSWSGTIQPPASLRL